MYMISCIFATPHKIWKSMNNMLVGRFFRKVECDRIKV